MNGGFANRLDYAFTSDQFRTTGEFPNDAFRITSGTANLGFRFSDATQLRAVYRDIRFVHRRSGAGGVRADELRREREGSRCNGERAAGRPARNAILAARAVRLSPLSRHVFGQRGGELQRGGADRTVPGGIPKTYFAGLAPTSCARIRAGIRRPVRFFRIHSHRSHQRRDIREPFRIAAARWCSATITNGRPGLISLTDVARDNNGAYVHEQYALTSRIYLTGGARLEHSSTFGNKFTPRGAVTFRLPTETYFRLSRLAASRSRR